jgi:hypothetical protein
VHLDIIYHSWCIIYDPWSRYHISSLEKEKIAIQALCFAVQMRNPRWKRSLPKLPAFSITSVCCLPVNLTFNSPFPQTSMVSLCLELILIYLFMIAFQVSLESFTNPLFLPSLLLGLALTRLLNLNKFSFLSFPFTENKSIEQSHP